MKNEEINRTLLQRRHAMVSDFDLTPYDKDPIQQVVDFLQAQRKHYLREAISAALASPVAVLPAGPDMHVLDIFVSDKIHGRGVSVRDILSEQYASRLIAEGVFAKNFTLFRGRADIKGGEIFSLYFQIVQP